MLSEEQAFQIRQILQTVVADMIADMRNGKINKSDCPTIQPTSKIKEKQCSRQQSKDPRTLYECEI